MSEAQWFVAQAAKVSLLALLIAMAMRGRLGLCWSLTLYVVATLVGNSLATFWPQRFFNYNFWVLKQGVYDSLKIAVAIELAWRAFSAFPGAWRIARVVIGVLLVASTLAVVWFTPRHWTYAQVWEWQPAVVTAGVWLLTAVALMVVLYQIPIGDWQRAIVLGFAPYMLASVTLMNLLERRGWQVKQQVALLDSVAFVGLILFWTHAAWRQEEPEREGEPVPVRSIA
ncbi:MAG TPA: hypothetical protein VII62_02155 [Vicinamibacteria bacterium]|jgi:hypothetical protein